MAQLMRTSNPALNDQAFRGQWAANGEAMTLEGTVNKTGLLLLCTAATAAWTWHLFTAVAFGSEYSAAALAGDHWRVYFRVGHGFQKGVVPGNRTGLRAP